MIRSLSGLKALPAVTSELDTLSSRYFETEETQKNQNSVRVCTCVVGAAQTNYGTFPGVKHGGWETDSL